LSSEPDVPEPGAQTEQETRESQTPETLAPEQPGAEPETKEPEAQSLAEELSQAKLEWEAKQREADEARAAWEAKAKEVEQDQAEQRKLQEAYAGGESADFEKHHASSLGKIRDRALAGGVEEYACNHNAIPPESNAYREKLLERHQPNSEQYPQFESMEICGATDIEKQRILDALDKIPESARASLPTIGRFYVEEAQYYQRPDGSQAEGILGVALSDYNEIFLNRTNLSTEQLTFEMGALQYTKSPERLAEYHDRLQSIQEGETVAWEDTIWHEVGHIHDKYLGFDGKFLSEMPGSPFGKEPWASNYAKETGKPYEDFAETYTKVLRLQQSSLSAGEPHEVFVRSLKSDPDFGDKYQFILKHFYQTE